jgi:hypothetical protein
MRARSVKMDGRIVRIATTRQFAVSKLAYQGMMHNRISKSSQGQSRLKLPNFTDPYAQHTLQ